MTSSMQQIAGSRRRAIRAFWDSSVGKKAVMAVTGLIGIGYVILHMIGNLQVFQGGARLNAYAALLHGPLNELLWVARVVLIAAVVLHVVAAWQLTQRDRAARPVSYRTRQPQVSTFASRTMRWGGVLLLVFIVVHVLHFTTGTVRPTGEFVPGDVYRNVVGSFRLWWVTLFYVAAMVALGFHLYHGAWSSVRTLGAAPPTRNLRNRPVAIVVAVIVAAGFCLVPLAVFFGLVK
jgi:succinate dehydrogenase / fumarate reductase, cytochrome b subunit